MRKPSGASLGPVSYETERGRRDEQRQHYDALTGDVERMTPCNELGAKTLRACFRTPYYFAERRLSALGLDGKLVLDYGCGPATFTPFFTAAGARVVGVDISRLTALAAKHRTDADSRRAPTGFLAGDCEKLPFADSTFDVVFSAGTLSCLDLQAAYRELRRVVSPAGHIVIIETLGHNPLLNLSRRIKLARGLKTRWSVSHILKNSSFVAAQDYFESVELQYFDALTFAMVPFARYEGLAECGTRALARLDRRLLRGPLRLMAFKLVAILSRPKKTTGRPDATQLKGQA